MHTTTNLSLNPYTFYKANILLLYYIISPILESSIIFSVSHDHVTYNCDIYDHPVISIMLLSYMISLHTFLFKFKIIKIKIKPKIK